MLGGEELCPLLPGAYKDFQQLDKFNLQIARSNLAHYILFIEFKNQVPDQRRRAGGFEGVGPSWAKERGAAPDDLPIQLDFA